MGSKKTKKLFNITRTTLKHYVKKDNSKIGVFIVYGFCKSIWCCLKPHKREQRKYTFADGSQWIKKTLRWLTLNSFGKFLLIKKCFKKSVFKTN